MFTPLSPSWAHQPARVFSFCIAKLKHKTASKPPMAAGKMKQMVATTRKIVDVDSPKVRDWSRSLCPAGKDLNIARLYSPIINTQKPTQRLKPANG